MAKNISDYTPQELKAIAEKVIERRQKDSEKAKTMQRLWALYKSGKITLPK